MCKWSLQRGKYSVIEMSVDIDDFVTIAARVSNENFYHRTRMHSSRMRTVHCNGCLRGRGGGSAQAGVCLGDCLPVGVSAQGDVCLGRCLPMGRVCPRGCLLKGVSA